MGILNLGKSVAAKVQVAIGIECPGVAAVGSGCYACSQKVDEALMLRVANKIEIIFLILVLATFAVGCGNSGKVLEELPDPEPTVTPLVQVVVISTFTPTVVVVVPEPTATEVPTLVPTQIAVVVRGRTNVQANLRSGPGLVFDVIGKLDEGTSVLPVARTGDRRWLKLDTGAWIFAALVDDIPQGLPVEASIPTPPPTETPIPVPPTEVPATSTPVPTNTPVPLEGDWSLPVHRNESFLMRDGVEISVLEVIESDDERMQAHIERRSSESCEGCLAIKIKIVNQDGNAKEYIVQEDFKLLSGSPDAEPFQQVGCVSSSGLHSKDNPEAFVKGFDEGNERFLCFEGVPPVGLETRLVYSPVYIYEDLNTPTSTPEGSSVIYATEPKEKEQEYRIGWSVYFILFGLGN